MVQQVAAKIKGESSDVLKKMTELKKSDGLTSNTDTSGSASGIGGGRAEKQSGSSYQ